MFGACLEIATEDSTKPYDFLEITAQNTTIVKDAPKAATVVVDFFTPYGFGSWRRSRGSVPSS